MSSRIPAWKAEMRSLDPNEGAEDEASLLSHENSNSISPSSRHDKTFVWGKLLLAGISFLVGIIIGKHDRNLDEACALHVSNYSPVLSDLKIEYHQQQYNGSFLHETIFRQGASPEVDAAWDSLGCSYRPIRVPQEEGQKSGISTNHVRISEKYGGGYPANVEGMHHLHCLNLLRQALYYNYNYYRALGQSAFKNDDYIVRRHVSHCLDILRQQLMCAVDIGVFGQIWVHRDHPEPFVDFNTAHRCRNFDEIRRWVEQHQLPEEIPPDFLQPPNSHNSVCSDIP